MHKKVILIGNHDLEIKDFLERSLGNGSLVLYAECTQATCKQIRERGASLVVLDENLPELGGLRLLRILKIAYPQIPVIITSRNPSYKGCLQAFRYGARDCFSKPYDFALLCKKVEIILNNLSEDNHLGKNYFLAEYKNDLSLEEKKILEEISTGDGKNGIYRAQKYLQENFQKDISRDKLSQIACLSPSHFSRVFKKRTGSSYIQYLTLLRINKAKELLKEKNINVSEVCYLVGYKDLSHFEKIFHKIVGCCPSSYRNGK